MGNGSGSWRRRLHRTSANVTNMGKRKRARVSIGLRVIKVGQKHICSHGCAWLLFEKKTIRVIEKPPISLKSPNPRLVDPAQPHCQQQLHKDAPLTSKTNTHAHTKLTLDIGTFASKHRLSASLTLRIYLDPLWSGNRIRHSLRRIIRCIPVGMRLRSGQIPANTCYCCSHQRNHPTSQTP